MQDIADAIGRDRVARVVDVFYEHVQAHPTLQAPFAGVHDWTSHKEILTHFWWVTLGGKRYIDYSYAVARKHNEAGFTPALLVDWLALFHEIVNAEIPPELAAGWIERAERIGQSLTYMHEVAQRGAAAPMGLYRPA
ncbi:MAG TPA: globin [Moraxellaceae bacterium]|nr:globin [Moraxellaceae bacterium]